MNLCSPKVVRDLLSRCNVSPSKIMGQNFLVNQQILAKIIEAAKLSPNDTVLEVGPGIGTLTRELAKTVRKIIAIEKDKKMIEILGETLRDCKNVEIIQDNILKFNPQNYSPLTTNYKLVANIPYYLTSPLIRKFLEEKNPPKTMTLMVQKEVAQRICSKPPDMSLLAVSVQVYAEPKIISYVKKESFWPSPKVDSAIIEIVPFNNKKTANLDLFFKIVKAGFSQPRKQMANNLSKSLKKDRYQINQWLLKNSTAPEQRAETLSIKDWLGLTASFDTIE